MSGCVHALRIGGPGAMACLRRHRHKAKVHGHWTGHFASAIWKFHSGIALERTEDHAYT
jgi:hypothetical protein